MTKRKPCNISVPISDWFPNAVTYDLRSTKNKVGALQKIGITVKIEFHPNNYVDRRYVAMFQTREQAAMFKLTHL